MSFNKAAFLEDANKVHLEVGGTLPVINVRREIDKFIDYDRSLFSRALDDICSNIVGNTMFTLLMTKLSPGRRLGIIDIGPAETRTVEALVDQKGSSYSREIHAVNINLNVYKRSGIGIRARQYYCIDEKGGIALKRKSVPSSLFHEFTHYLHHVEDAEQYERDRTPPDPRDELWTSKEECRTIAGYIAPNIFDPICDNCFHLCESVTEPTQRHPVAGIKSTTYRMIVGNPTCSPTAVPVIPYRPRLGHIGYVKGAEYSKEDLLQFRRNLNFDLAWPKRYV
jgi:hypothetical protein